MIVEGVIGGSDDCAGLDVGRNHHGGHTHSEAREIERRRGRILVVGIHAGRRRDVIEEAAVLVVDDQQQGLLPDFRAAGQSRIDIVNERFSVAHVVVGVLVGRLMRAAGVVRIVARLDETVVRQGLWILAVVQEIVVQAEVFGLIAQQFFEGQRHGVVLIVDFGGDLLLVQHGIDGVQIAEERRSHSGAHRGGRMGERPVGQGGSRH